MKNFIVMFCFMHFVFLQTSFIEKKLENASVALIDVLEHVHKNYIPSPQEYVDIIDEHIDDLFDRALAENGKSMRMYTFISLDISFDSYSSKDIKYIFYSLLYAEIDPAVLTSMNIEDVDCLKKTVSKKILELYENKKIGIEEIRSGCYVACVESGTQSIHAV